MFESLEEFHIVLSELVGDESMDKVRGEYEKLIHALKKSRENEKRLMSKCRELNAEVVSTSTKVAAALKLSQDDETTITSLKRVKGCQSIRCYSIVMQSTDLTLEDFVFGKEAVAVLYRFNWGGGETKTVFNILTFLVLYRVVTHQKNITYFFQKQN